MQVVTLDTETMGVLGLGVCEDLLWFSPVVEMEVVAAALSNTSL